jgi:DNA-binding MarR family transcriptional regulator
MQRSLGTQLRHLVDLLDGAVERRYAAIGLAYRPRYTPVMRCLIAREPLSLGEVARGAGITQPAATQTVALMIRDGLVETARSGDARRKLLRLTGQGRAMAAQLQQAWDATARAAASLDEDLPMPLSATLAAAIAALEMKSFDERIADAGSQPQGDSNCTAS